MIQIIADAKLVERSRVVMEKPFGTDLASAVALNNMLHQYFDEDQIFRIDHFLGKEAVQNILAFRFGNGLFEPIWNRDHIDNVQIDVPETLGVDDRVGFYEATGAFKDMVVTHLFQIMGFMAMEPPTALAPDPIADEKDKVFRSMRPLDVTQVVRGQYAGYRDLPGVAPDSETETFIALRCEIDNWRWAGVPFFLRTGKELGGGERIISIAFREPPQSMFPEGSGVGTQGPDHLTFDLADSSKLSLSFYGKKPGPGMKLEKLSLQIRAARHGPGRGRLGGVREAFARRHGRRPHLVQHGRGNRAAVGDLDAAARAPTPGAAVRAWNLGAGGDQRPHRASDVAPPVHAPLEVVEAQLSAPSAGRSAECLQKP